MFLEPLLALLWYSGALLKSLVAPSLYSEAPLGLLRRLSGPLEPLLVILGSAVALRGPWAGAPWSPLGGPWGALDRSLGAPRSPAMEL